MGTDATDPRRFDRLRWKARRGLLENDLLLSPFLEKELIRLTEIELAALDQLLQLGDNDLLDLLMGRTISSELQQVLLVNKIRNTSSN